MQLPRVSRRNLLIGGGAGAGLVIAFLTWPRQEGSPLRSGPRDKVVGPYLRVGSDGRVTLAVPQVEVGQGIWTGLAQIAADELGAAWETMAVEPAPPAAAFANALIAEEYGISTRITAGSTSIRAFEQPIREAAAAARMMLCEAAAERWQINAAECDTDGGFVIHEGKRIGFGELADAAAARPMPLPRLRPTGSGSLAGEALPRLDLPSKSDGSLRFASDVRLPGMIFASIRMAPPGARLRGYSEQAAKVGKGLIDLVVREGWIAALGQTWWAADQALQRAAAKFTGRDSGDIDVRLAYGMESGPTTRLFEHGDYASATQGSRPLAATYSLAATPHRSLEAPSAVARFRGGRLELWVGTQVPDLARAAAAKAVDLPESQVSLTPMPVGDGSGSAMTVEAAAIAGELARHARRPVCLSFPPATAQNHDAMRPPMLARMSALPAGDGSLASWSARIVGMAGTASSLGETEPKFAPRGVSPPYGLPAIRVDTIEADLPLRTGYMRGGDEAMMCFCTESFIDEMARAMGIDPLGLRMGMLGAAPRLARALTSAATLGGWDGGRPGSSMGLACASLFGSHIALLVEAGLGPDQRVKVSRMVAAVDCGRAINPGLVRQQIEGGLLSALAAATVPTPALVAGMPRAEPRAGKGFERLAEVPTIDVEVLRSREPSGGVSGLGMAVLAPAVANAIAAATGRRLRKLPFDPMAEL